MPDRRQMLNDVLCEVLEQMAFMFGEESSADELPPPEEGYVQAQMTFSGPFSGSLAIAVAEEMCPELAANMLGTEADSERAKEEARDALKELLNITCGKVLTTLAGDEPVFDLSVPQASEMSAEEWNAMAGGEETAAVLADDYPVLLSIHIDE